MLLGETLCAIAVAHRQLGRDAATGRALFAMMTINCTKKLAGRIPFPLVDHLPPTSNVLGAWCANIFNVGRTPLIIVTNEKTLLSVLLPFKEIRTFHGRFLDSLEVLLHSIALSSGQIQTELENMQIVQYTDRTNRSVLASMNDFVINVRAHEPGHTLDEVSFNLSGIPCGPLKYGTPREAVLEVIDPPPHRFRSTSLR